MFCSVIKFKTYPVMLICHQLFDLLLKILSMYLIFPVRKMIDAVYLFVDFIETDYFVHC